MTRRRAKVVRSGESVAPSLRNRPDRSSVARRADRDRRPSRRHVPCSPSPRSSRLRDAGCPGVKVLRRRLAQPFGQSGLLGSANPPTVAVWGTRRSSRLGGPGRPWRDHRCGGPPTGGFSALVRSGSSGNEQFGFAHPHFGGAPHYAHRISPTPVVGDLLAVLTLATLLPPRRLFAAAQAARPPRPRRASRSGSIAHRTCTVPTLKSLDQLALHP